MRAAVELGVGKCSLYVPQMGARDPTRIERLASWQRPTPGHVRVAVCAGCGHQGALPVDRLIQRLGTDYPVEMASTFLRCSQCGARKVAAKLLLLAAVQFRAKTAQSSERHQNRREVVY